MPPLGTVLTHRGMTILLTEYYGEYAVGLGEWGDGGVPFPVAFRTSDKFLKVADIVPPIHELGM